MNSPAGHWGARPARSGSWSPAQSSPEPWPCTRRPAERHPPSLLALTLCRRKAVPTSCEAGGSGTEWQETPPVAGRGSAPVGQASISPWTVGGAASAGREGKPTPGQVGRYLSTVQYGRAQCGRLAGHQGAICSRNDVPFGGWAWPPPRVPTPPVRSVVPPGAACGGLCAPPPSSGRPGRASRVARGPSRPPGRPPSPAAPVQGPGFTPVLFLKTLDKPFWTLPLNPQIFLPGPLSCSHRVCDQELGAPPTGQPCPSPQLQLGADAEAPPLGCRSRPPAPHAAALSPTRSRAARPMAARPRACPSLAPAWALSACTRVSHCRGRGLATAEQALGVGGAPCVGVAGSGVAHWKGVG